VSSHVATAAKYLSVVDISHSLRTDTSRDLKVIDVGINNMIYLVHPRSGREMLQMLLFNQESLAAANKLAQYIALMFIH